jgi:HSP20 family protein
MGGVLPGRQAAGLARCTRENDMTVMASWEVFEDLRAGQDDLVNTGRERAMRHGLQLMQQQSAGTWAPAVEICERRDAYVVRAELPGVSAGEVEITFGEGLLTIQGERHANFDAAGEKPLRSECCYGAFRRSITLPSHVQAGKIEASAHDGVLQVTVPKAQEVQAKRIPVRAGEAKTAIAHGGKSNGS